jgi:hypothetical protein
MEMLEDRPVLRERVLAATAISAVLIGGGMAMNSIITGGWQWGVASASEHQLYYDDVNQQWSEPAPLVPVAQPVALAATAARTSTDADTPAAVQTVVDTRGLDGASATVSLTSYAPTQPAPDATQPAVADSEAASKARYDQLEADIRQADPQQNYVQNITTDDSAPNF